MLFSSVQSLSHVWLFVTPWTAVQQASLSITNSWSSLKLMSINSVMPSNHLILCHPLPLPPSIFPSIRVFSKESVLQIRGASIGVSASTSVFPVNIQDWFLLGLTNWISLQSKAEKVMAPHSSTLAWKIPWMEEPGRLQSMGSLRVGHDWENSLSLFTFMHWRRKWQPTPVFLPGQSQGRGSLVGGRLWGLTESDTTEVT